MAVATFFRVLENAPTINDAEQSVANPQSTLNRWKRFEYNSSHNAIPPDWIKEWNLGKHHAHQIALLCADGLHTIAALKAFIVAATASGLGQIPIGGAPGDPMVIGELDGTCAYCTREEAWAYVLGDNQNPASLTKVNMTCVVEFTGLEMGIVIPEANSGGVQVKVITPGVPQSAVDYAHLHNLDLPPEEETGEIPLNY